MDDVHRKHLVRAVLGGGSLVAFTAFVARSGPAPWFVPSVMFVVSWVVFYWALWPSLDAYSDGGEVRLHRVHILWPLMASAAVVVTWVAWDRVWVWMVAVAWVISLGLHVLLRRDPARPVAA